MLRLIEKLGDYIERLWTDNLKEIRVFLKKISYALLLKWSPYDITSFEVPNAHIYSFLSLKIWKIIQWVNTTKCVLWMLSPWSWNWHFIFIIHNVIRFFEGNFKNALFLSTGVLSTTLLQFPYKNLMTLCIVNMKASWLWKENHLIKYSYLQYPQGLCSLAPGYNMCILRGWSVSDSFVMVIGGQMASRRPVFVPSVLTLQAVTVVLWEVNSVCNIHSRVWPCPAKKYVLCLATLVIWMGLHFVPVGIWMDISKDCCTY